MVLTESTQQFLGQKMPSFTLPDTQAGEPLLSNVLSLDDLLSEKATVIIFMCNHCPFVKHILPTLSKLSGLYQAKGVSFVAISANDAEKYPDDAPDKMRELTVEHNLSFPYLYDETQAVAKAYDAQCTPEFFIADGKGMCVYHGQFDESTPGNNLPATGQALTQALDALLAGQAVDPHQKPSVGCSIKWK